MSKQVFLGKFTIGNDNDSFKFGATAIDLNHGDYFLAGPAGDQNGLCWLLQNRIRTDCPMYTTTNVVFYPQNQKVYVYPGPGEMPDMNFTDAGLARILGMHVNNTGVLTAYVGYTTPRYVFAPSKDPAYYPTVSNNPFQPRSKTRYGRTEDGTTYTVPKPTLYDGSYQYNLLPANEAINTGITFSNGDSYWGSFEHFFKDVICEGQPMRVLPDREAAYTANTYVEAIFGEDGGGEVGALDEIINRYVASYNGLWNVRLPLLKHQG